MKRLLLATLLLVIAASVQAQNSLIISQYVDTDAGMTPKGVELWNVSGGGIDFASTPLVISKGTNGGALDADVTVNTGGLDAGAVMVVGTADMGAYLVDRGLEGVVFVEKSFTFNGNDALQVTLGGGVEDTFGTPGSDPGSAWTGGGVSTADQNIALLVGITTGDVDGFTDPSGRFEVVSGAPASACGLAGFGIAPGDGATSCQPVFDGAGWRLLSAPVTGLTVTDLAGINLVQGVVAGSPASSFPAQYESEDANVYVEYVGSSNIYIPVADADEVVTPGRGFFWYWFDSAFGPFSGGTSQSYELSSYVLSASGPALTSDQVLAFSRNPSGFYLLGNPFADALTFEAGAISSSVGTLQSSVYAYDPSAASGAGDYVTLTEGAATIQPWQGIFAEIDQGGGFADPTVTYAAASVDPASTGGSPFYGRRAQEAQIALSLQGTLSNGAVVGDETALIRVLPDAALGWDRHDLSELLPPNADLGRLALVGERRGEPRRQGVLSLPEDVVGPVAVPVSFLASGSGTFEIAWDVAALPSGWTATMRDLATQAERDLTVSGTYTFESEATEWAERFEVVVSASAVAGEDAPAGWELSEVYPNPAAGAARLGLRVSEGQRVTAAVYDALGREVIGVFDGEMAPSTNLSLLIPTDALAPGVYAVRVEGEAFVATRRLVVVR